MEEQGEKRQLQSSADGEPLQAEIVLPNSPQIVISSKDLQNLANLERIVQDSKDLNLTIIDIDVYAAQM